MSTSLKAYGLKNYIILHLLLTWPISGSQSGLRSIISGYFDIQSEVMIDSHPQTPSSKSS